MSLTVHFLCSYYSHRAHLEVAQRSPSLWDAYMFCKAVKTRTINGYCTVPSTPPEEINQNNVVRARQLFGAYIRHTLGDETFGSAYFVPVPSKDSFDNPEFRSFTMLRESLTNAGPDRIIPAVSFTSPLGKASEGGPRGYSNMFPHLSVNRIPPGPIVLVDDILTSGGTMLATKDRLVQAGANVVCAVVCGKTTSSLEPGFKLRTFELDDHTGSFDIDISELDW